MHGKLLRLAGRGLCLLPALLLVPALTLAQARPSIADLQARIATLESQVDPDLPTYLQLDRSDPARPTVRVTGANLQVVNGSGVTGVSNGVGNLILGYNVRPTNQRPSECSIGVFDTANTCTSSGGVWATNHQSGSHNLVIGNLHNFSGHSGIVAGLANSIMAPIAVALAGPGNRALAFNSTVTGGADNTARGFAATVSGGAGNQANGDLATVTGGESNVAAAEYSSVSGGLNRTAPGPHDWVAGGLFQTE